MIRDFLSRLFHNVADTVWDSNASLLRQIERSVEEADEEAVRRDRLGLLDVRPPQHWHSWYFTRNGFRESANYPDENDHWKGGPARHKGAVCPVCQKTLVLFWDVNCRDPRFPKESFGLFQDLECLPLYDCPRHPESTVYQVLSDTEIETLTPAVRPSEGTPFKDIPNQFDRKPLRLEPIPRDIENLLIVADEFDFEWLNTAERDAIASFLGNKIHGDFDIHFSQFGGKPRFMQGHAEIDCPNPECETHLMGHPLLRRAQEFRLKELAAIDDIAGLGAAPQYAQVAFHICWKCRTIHADYVCT